MERTVLSQDTLRNARPLSFRTREAACDFLRSLTRGWDGPQTLRPILRFIPAGQTPDEQEILRQVADEIFTGRILIQEAPNREAAFTPLASAPATPTPRELAALVREQQPPSEESRPESTADEPPAPEPEFDPEQQAAALVAASEEGKPLCET